MATKTTIAVTVMFNKHARGDIGPCAHDACGDRAARIYDICVNGVWMRTWVCDTHGDALEAIHG